MDSNFDDDDFDDLDSGLAELAPDALNDLEYQTRLSISQRAPAASAVVPQAPPHQGASSDYGSDGEDVIDLDSIPAPAPVDEVTLREQWRQQRYGTSQTWSNNRQNVHNPGQSQIDVPNRRAQAGTYENVTRTDESPNNAAQSEDEHVHVDLNGLKARIAELERERVELRKVADDARSAALARAGEISIVRANNEKTAKDFDKRIASLQTAHAQETAKVRAELEAARKDREKIETTNKFLEHDLAQEAEKARNMKRTLKDGHGNVSRPAQGSPISTPKKNKALAFRDGFEDDEVMLVSPSKARERTKPLTPRSGAKRKRPQIDKAPIESPKLSFAEPDREDEGMGVIPVDDSPKSHQQLSAPTKPHPEPDQSNEKLELMQRILNHRSDPDRERSLEVLTKFHFPSNGQHSISAAVYDGLGSQIPNQTCEQYRLRICENLMKLWSQCLHENYHAPLYDLTELLQYILLISDPSLSASVISTAVPLCQKTADQVAVPIAKASKTSFPDETQLSLLRERINPLDYLGLLHLIALNCESAAELYSFWSAMEFDFVLVMLHKAQPIEQMIEMLHLLFTAVLDNTFGAIAPLHLSNEDSNSSSTAEAARQKKQQKMENDILDRLTVLLFEIPQSHPPILTGTEEERGFSDNHSIAQSTSGNATTRPQPTPTTILALRTTALYLLNSLARTPRGASLLAAHRLAIPRLVRFLHESLLQLYAYFPSATQPQTVACVNTTVLLLAHLDTIAAGSGGSGGADSIRAKLVGVPGGPQRWLVSLSRVAFAESDISDDGGSGGGAVTPEARDAAHRLLDEMLSPEEGEGVLRVFSSGR